jgi:hypothetical protein
MKPNSCACYGSNDIHECFCNLNKNNMKNIHLIPTENPSSLFEIDGHLIINKKQLIQPKYYRNIYITSDEEIKIGNWVLNIEENTIFKPSTYEIYHIKNSEAKYYEYCKKIILTTDHDLFKDDVQAINDEFHDWFVKNPSCEFVEVELKTKHLVKPYDVYNEQIPYYKINIPQEEAKQKQKQHLIDLIRLDGQETLEEAAERIYPVVIKPILDVYDDGVSNQIGEEDINKDSRESFIAGAKWQQEQNKNKYSEEEVEKMVRAAYTFGEKEFKYFGAFKEWFEQFKKK